jgi:hypothetical protein
VHQLGQALCSTRGMHLSLHVSRQSYHDVHNQLEDNPGNAGLHIVTAALPGAAFAHSLHAHAATGHPMLISPSGLPSWRPPVGCGQYRITALCQLATKLASLLWNVARDAYGCRQSRKQTCKTLDCAGAQLPRHASMLTCLCCKWLACAAGAGCPTGLPTWHPHGILLAPCGWQQRGNGIT